MGFVLLLLLLFLSFFKTRSHNILQTGLEFPMLLPQAPVLGLQICASMSSPRGQLTNWRCGLGKFGKNSYLGDSDLWQADEVMYRVRRDLGEPDLVTPSFLLGPQQVQAVKGLRSCPDPALRHPQATCLPSGKEGAASGPPVNGSKESLPVPL